MSKFLTYCKLTCLGGSEKGECPCRCPAECTMTKEMGYEEARRKATRRMTEWMVSECKKIDHSIN